MYFYQGHGSQIKVILGLNTRMYIDVELDNLEKLSRKKMKGGNSVIIFNKVNFSD